MAGKNLREEPFRESGVQRALAGFVARLEARYPGITDPSVGVELVQGRPDPVRKTKTGEAGGHIPRSHKKAS